MGTADVGLVAHKLQWQLFSDAEVWEQGNRTIARQGTRCLRRPAQTGRCAVCGHHRC